MEMLTYKNPIYISNTLRYSIPILGLGGGGNKVYGCLKL